MKAITPQQRGDRERARVFDHDLVRALRPLRVRLFLAQGLSWLIWAAFAISVFFATVFLLSRFVPIVDRVMILAAGSVMILVISLALGVLSRPGLWKAAEAADSLGLDQRVVTALEAEEGSGKGEAGSGLLALQYRDALEKLRSLDPTQYRIRVSRPLARLGQRALALALLATVLAYMPNPLDDIALQRRLDRDGLERASTAIEELIEEIGGQELAEAVPLEEDPDELGLAEELRAALESLAADVSESANLTEAAAEVTSALEAVQGQERGAAGAAADLARLAQALSGKGAADPLAKALAEAGDGANPQGSEEVQKQVEDALNSLAQALSQMSSEDLAQLAGELQTVANDTAAAELKEQLRQLASQLAQAAASGSASSQPPGTSDGLLADVAQSLQGGGELAQLLSGMVEAAGALGQLSQASAGLTELANTIGQAAAQVAGMPAIGANGNGDGSGSGNGSSGADSGTGTGSGSGDGSGQGAGSGSSDGAGAGSGTGAGSGGAGSGAGGSGAGTGSANTIFDPVEGLEAGGDQSQVGGEIRPGQGGQQTTLPGMPAVGGTLVPYTSVYARYSQQAMEALNRQNLPLHLRDLVKEYFTSLDPGP